MCVIQETPAIRPYEWSENNGKIYVRIYGGSKEVDMLATAKCSEAIKNKNYSKEQKKIVVETVLLGLVSSGIFLMSGMFVDINRLLELGMLKLEMGE